MSIPFTSLAVAIKAELIICDALAHGDIRISMLGNEFLKREVTLSFPFPIMKKLILLSQFRLAIYCRPLRTG